MQGGSIVKVLATLVVAALAGLSVSAQSQMPGTPQPEFDVASVKRNNSGDPMKSNFPLGPGAMYSPNGGTFSASSAPIWIYIAFAYKLTSQAYDSLQKQLPPWAVEERYDIEARTDRHDVTKDEMRQMMQSLLADRFKLAVHASTEQAPVFALTLAKQGTTGPKLRPHPVGDTTCSNSISSAPETDTVEGGFPAVCGGLAIVPASAAGHLAAGFRNVPVKMIAAQMSMLGGLDRAVVDATGLAGNWDFVIDFAPERQPSAINELDTSGLTFRDALIEQTGLKLVPQKGPIDIIVIDRIEHPTPN
jgi:uncharacterized protein (TIGR03435 family)